MPLPTTVMPRESILKTLASEFVFSDKRNCFSPGSSQLGSCPSSIEPSLTPMGGPPRGKERRRETSAIRSVAVGCFWFRTRRGCPSERDPPVKRICCGYGRSFKWPSPALPFYRTAPLPNFTQLAVTSPSPAVEVNKNSRRFISGNYCKNMLRRHSVNPCF